ncbi:MAG TPA: hypothetical protein VK867_05020 [Candidatus Limnocylindrales bacterium]|nr:hypothetical protein [Candidatus Limnocylindrales bacterium]
MLDRWRIAMAFEWTFAELEPAQVDLIHEAERTLDTDVVLAYAPTRWGTVDPDAVGETLTPVELQDSQIEYLQGLERKVGGVLVAYRLSVD